MIRPSLFSGQREIYLARSSPKLDPATSTAHSSPVSPLVFAEMSSFPGPSLNCDASHDLELSNSPAYKENTIITFGSRARTQKYSNISGVVTEKTGKRLELDALDARISNKDLA